MPVVDLHCLAGAEACPPHLSSRIILVAPHRAARDERLIGLLASQVADTRLEQASGDNVSVHVGTNAGGTATMSDSGGVLVIGAVDRPWRGKPTHIPTTPIIVD